MKNPKSEIWSHAGVGAKAAIYSFIDDIPDNVTAVGVPAKVIKQHRKGA